MGQESFFLSVIIPVYNESGNIKTLLDRLLPILRQYDHEIIFIDDGSTDNTVNEIKSTSKKTKNIKILSFTRNFGHQNALSAGYKYAKGDCVISIDADLQDPPELIHEMVKAWHKGYEIVYARRRSRANDSIFKKYSAWAFYWLINTMSEVVIPSDVGDYRLLDSTVVKYLNSLPERALFLRGLVAWSGYRTTYVDFDRDIRHCGTTHYPLRKMISFAVTGIAAFSAKPLRIVIYFGFLTACMGFLGMAYAFARRFLLPHEYWVTGWTAIFVSIMFFSGVQMLVLGVIGEYIGRIFGQVQHRPLYLIREQVNIDPQITN